MVRSGIPVVVAGNMRVLSYINRVAISIPEKSDMNAALSQVPKTTAWREEALIVCIGPS